MISYEPFYKTLKEKGVSTYKLINEYGISRSLLDRLKIITVGLFPAVCDDAFMSVLHQFPAGFRRDPPGAAKASNGVDEQIFHVALLLHNNRKFIIGDGKPVPLGRFFSIFSRPSCPPRRCRTG